MTLTEREIKDAFEQAMRDAGIVPEFRSGQGVEFGQNDGKPHRFHIAGDSKGTRNGWFVLFADGVPAGEFGSWKTGATHSWCAKKRNELSDQERKDIEQRIEAARVEREREQKKREGDAAKRANLLWNESVPSSGTRILTWSGKGFRRTD